MVSGSFAWPGGIEGRKPNAPWSAMTLLPCDVHVPAVTVTEAVAVSFVPRVMVMRSPVASPMIVPPSTVQAYVAPGTAATATVAVPDLHALGGACTTTVEEHSAMSRTVLAKKAMANV